MTVRLDGQSCMLHDSTTRVGQSRVLHDSMTRVGQSRMLHDSTTSWSEPYVARQYG